MRTYIASGFSQKEAAKAALEQPSSRVSMYQDTETTSETPAYTYYFRYIPYLFLAVLCYSMGYILLAFQKERYPETYAGFIRFHSPAEP